MSKADFFNQVTFSGLSITVHNPWVHTAATRELGARQSILLAMPDMIICYFFYFSFISSNFQENLVS